MEQDADGKGRSRNKKRRSKKSIEKIEELDQNGEPRKPLPPNVFLYIQLASITALPQTINKLELHLHQGDSTIVKCVEHYNTEGVIYQEEFEARPTFTLIIPQDNIERINQISDNPLLITLFMRVPPPEEEEEAAEEEAGEGFLVDGVELAPSTPRDLSDKRSDRDVLVLISVGYIDLLKLLGKRRTMVKEDLYLYPVPDVSNELRRTSRSEWHLYTLLPLIKEISITNLAFVIFEAVYNFAVPYPFDDNEIRAELLFRATAPNELNEFETSPFCEFNSLKFMAIREQVAYHIYENLQLTGYGTNPVHGLQTPIEIEKHMLLKNLLRSEGLRIDAAQIDCEVDDAFVANSFHRFVLNKDCSNQLFSFASCHSYVIQVNIWTTGEKEVKIFEGTLDPAVLAYPNVKSVRFAVELQYVGPIRASNIKRNTKMSQVSMHSFVSSHSFAKFSTFATIRFCLFSPLGESKRELENFSEAFANQNRLQICDHAEPDEPPLPPIEHVVQDAYNAFDAFIEQTIAYVLLRCVHDVNEKKEHFCCDVKNLTNILLRLVGAAFNYYTPTKTNVEFTNLCVDAYNQLELRVHEIVEKKVASGLREAAFHFSVEFEKLIDHMNTIKFLTEVGDTVMADYLLDKITHETKLPDMRFFKLIHDMEQKNYAAAEEYFGAPTLKSVSKGYFSGWIKLYMNYMSNRDNAETAPDALEFLLRDITNYALQHPTVLDGWVLLHSYYKRFKYWPGSDFARWRYEDLASEKLETTKSGPWSLLDIFLSHTPELRTQKGTMFIKVQMVFMHLGLYEFAQVIFETVMSECTEVDRYLFTANINILNKTLDKKFHVRNFPSKNPILAAFINQTNGNIEYYRGNYAQAKQYYMRNINVDVSMLDRDYFLLSSMRLAYLAFASGDYQVAITALSKPIRGDLLTLMANFLMGRAQYRLGDLPKALEHFALCTTFKAHVPDVWAYLALINLRDGEIFNALECWKLAKSDPTDVVSEEIYDELDKIDYDDCDLYVDEKK